MSTEVQECPFCGEEILAKAKKCKHCGEFLDDSNRFASSSSQSSNEDKSAHEATLWEGHTSHLYYLGAHIVCGIVGLFTCGIGFIGNLYCFMLAKSTKFKLTNMRLSSEKGILSKQTAEVAVRDIRSVSLKQGILEKLLGLGTVEIGSAGTAGIEVAFQGIKQAPQVKDQVTRLKNELLK
jgi:membrane protein YdbS with pleckstrin-like domain